MGYLAEFSEANARPIGVAASTRAASTALLFLPVAILVAGTLSAAAFMAAILDLEWLPLIPYYALASMLVTLIVILGVIFAQVCVMARRLHPDPLGELRSRWLKRSLLPRLILPIVIVPLFMAAFVTLKAAATMSIPYDWDLYLANLDHRIFGIDPWMPLHLLLDRWYFPDFLQFWYLGWQLILPASLVSCAIWMKPKDAATYYCAMFLTWIIAGVLLADWLHSAGPAFAYIFNGELGRRFEPLNFDLVNDLGAQSRILSVHIGLALAVGDQSVSRGGGISAMPSVHLAVTGVYVCALWGHRYWRAAALAFAGTIWVGSVYFGYHYVTDGPLGFATAVLCWWASRRIVDLCAGHNRTPPSDEDFRTVSGPLAQGV